MSIMPSNEEGPVPPALPAEFDGLVPPWGPQFLTHLGVAAWHHRGPDKIDFVAPAHVAVVLMTPQPARKVRCASSRWRAFDAPAGTLEIMPAGADFSGQWEVPKENLYFAYTSEQLARLALHEFGTDKIELHPPVRATVDDECLAMAYMLKRELSLGPAANALSVESVMTLFAMRLLRGHSNISALPRIGAQGRVQGGLSARSKKAVLAYMHDRLGDPLRLADLASEVGLSPGYFLRAFKQTFGETPHRYLLKIRLERVENLVRQSNLPLAHIAALAGFASQSHMTATMRSLKGYTPRRLRDERSGSNSAVPKTIGGCARGRR